MQNWFHDTRRFPAIPVLTYLHQLFNAALLFEFISIQSWATTGGRRTRHEGGHSRCPQQIADAHLPEAASVFDAATALDTAMDTVDPQPTLVEFLVRHVLLSRELLPQSR